MKYLKNINQLFEELRDKSKFTVKEFSEEINQYLYPFSDIGYEVRNNYAHGGSISIFKMSYSGKFKNPIEFSDIKLDLFSLLSYVNEVTDIDGIKIFYFKSKDDMEQSTSNLGAKQLDVSIRMKEFSEDILSDIKDDYLVTSISIYI